MLELLDAWFNPLAPDRRRSRVTSFGAPALGPVASPIDCAPGPPARMASPMADATIPPADVLALGSLLAYAEQGIASRVLAKTAGGNVTLFAFDAGQGLSEHTAPFDALVFVVEGALALIVGGRAVVATPGTVVRMPANVPHALEATARTKMLLVMLRSPGA